MSLNFASLNRCAAAKNLDVISRVSRVNLVVVEHGQYLAATYAVAFLHLDGLQPACDFRAHLDVLRDRLDAARSGNQGRVRTGSRSGESGAAASTRPARLP